MYTCDFYTYNYNKNYDIIPIRISVNILYSSITNTNKLNYSNNCIYTIQSFIFVYTFITVVSHEDVQLYFDILTITSVNIQSYQLCDMYNYLFNRLHLFKICLCCFLDMHLYSNNLSTIATISSLIKSELFPACFSCNNNFNLLQSS